MKKSGILNSDISRVLSYMGHTDTIAVGDCGLPVPEETERIDLALREGLPSFMDVLETVSADMNIEKIVLAEEIRADNQVVLERILALCEKLPKQCQVEYISHEELKLQLKTCRAVIRTGEATPYSNIILQSGCRF